MELCGASRQVSHRRTHISAPFGPLAVSNTLWQTNTFIYIDKHQACTSCGVENKVNPTVTWIEQFVDTILAYTRQSGLYVRFFKAIPLKLCSEPQPHNAVSQGANSCWPRWELPISLTSSWYELTLHPTISAATESFREIKSPDTAADQTNNEAQV